MAEKRKYILTGSENRNRMKAGVPGFEGAVESYVEGGLSGTKPTHQRTEAMVLVTPSTKRSGALITSAVRHIQKFDVTVALRTRETFFRQRDVFGKPRTERIKAGTPRDAAETIRRRIAVQHGAK